MLQKACRAAAGGRPVAQVGDDLRDRRRGDETTPYPPIGAKGAPFGPPTAARYGR
jgi:hypothetical protein